MAQRFKTEHVTFDDETGELVEREERVHVLRIDLNVIEHVKTHTDIDLLDIATTEKLPKTLSKDIPLAVDVLFHAAQPKDMNIVTFSSGLVGTYLADAVDALIESIIDYFPPHQAIPLREAKRQLDAAQKRATEMMTETIRGPQFATFADKAIQSMSDPLTDKKLDALLNQMISTPTSDRPSTKSPAPSASTQDR